MRRLYRRGHSGSPYRILAAGEHHALRLTCRIHEPRLPNLTEDTEEPEITVADSEIPWSSELPFLTFLDAGEMSYYFSAQEDELVRGVAISLQREKFILHYLEDPLEYLKHFATYT